MPAISVIVPLYNTEEYIGECLESLKVQTFSDFQVVVVDDASTDDSLACARRAAGDDERFVFVSRPVNGGLSAARNTGLDNATGDYIAFLDSDDRFAPNTLERLHEAAVQNDADLVDFSIKVFYDTEEVKQKHREDYSYRRGIPGIMTGAQLFTQYVEQGQFVAAAWCHFIKRSVLDDPGEAGEPPLRFVKGLLHEDEMFTPQVYTRSQRAMLLCEELYERRVREGSIMTTPFTARNVDSIYRIAQMHHAWLIQNAERFDAAFLDAYAFNIAVLRDSAFRHLTELPEQQVQEYLDSLSAQDRVDFDLTCRYAQRFAQDRCDEIADSRAFRAAQSLRGLANRLPSLPGRNR